jgi:putative membrane protein
MTDHALLTDWKVYPSFLVGWILLALLYAIGVGPLRRRYRLAERPDHGRAAFFAAGLGVMFVALQGPIHELSDHYLFSVHMLQHLLLTLAVPPLLLAGTPAWLLRPVLRTQAVARVARFLTRPLVAFGLYNALFAAWHVPALYDVVMRDHDVHIVMHLSILAAAVILWWPVVTPVPELNHLAYGGQILYLFLLGLPMMALASLITLADHVLYPFYAEAPRLWGLTALEDQQIGGLLMWVPGSAVLWIGITVAFFKWSTGQEGSASSARPSAPGVPRPRR